MTSKSKLTSVVICLTYVSFWIPTAGASPQQTAEANSASTGWPGFGHTHGWKSALKLPTTPFLNLAWQQDVGEGQSQVVGDTQIIYVASGSSKQIAGSKNRKLQTILTARSIDGGDVKWTYRTESVMTDKQETFGGNKPTPQATPLLLNDRIILMTFTGELICVNTQNGKELWQKQLTKEVGAEEVQFGFSSSAVACPDSDNQFVVLAAGRDGGLLRMSAKSGEVLWVGSVTSFSYATPVFVRLGDKPQWVVVSQDEVLGFDHDSGAKLWRFELPEKGLTNVPSPLVVDESTILISGQGMQGTKCLSVQHVGNGWKVTERWSNRKLQFFYTNWLSMSDKFVIGCTEQFLTAFELKTGKQLGRFRGYANGNLLQADDRYLLLDGKGNLNLLAHDKESTQLVASDRFALGKGRFWSAPSVIGENLLVRFDSTLCCYRFSPSGSAGSLRNRIAREEPRLHKL
ncbi:MAG: PQQ-binding-like beta-propeller repeat protein, partial [Planctomycetaceae bacterium]